MIKIAIAGMVTPLQDTTECPSGPGRCNFFVLNEDATSRPWQALCDEDPVGVFLYIALDYLQYIPVKEMNEGKD